MNLELQEERDGFICGHPFIVASQIKYDSALVPDPLDPTNKVKKNKLYCKCLSRNYRMTC